MPYIVEQKHHPHTPPSGRWLTGWHTETNPPTPIWGRRRHALVVNEPSEEKFNTEHFTGAKFHPVNQGA